MTNQNREKKTKEKNERTGTTKVVVARGFEKRTHSQNLHALQIAVKPLQNGY